MSTANIISIESAGDEIGNVMEATEIGGALGAAAAIAASPIIVTFRVRGGTLAYRYDDPIAVAEIRAGGDPAQYSGTRV